MLKCIEVMPAYKKGDVHNKKNKRSMDLCVPLDNCICNDKRQFSADLHQKLTAAD